MESTFTGLIQALSGRLSGQTQAQLEIRDNNKVHVNFDDIALLMEHLPDAEQFLTPQFIQEKLPWRKTILPRFFKPLAHP